MKLNHNNSTKVRMTHPKSCIPLSVDELINSTDSDKPTILV
jgi:hypothetical protein